MTAPILVGLVVMWAVVLVPMWLKRHDEIEETRSVDRFTSAMHTLSRKEAKAEAKYVVMPQRSSSHEVHVSGASADGKRATRVPVRKPKKTKRAMTAADRRRRTLTGLLAITVVTFVAAFFVGGMLLWTLQILADIALVGFVASLVMYGRRTAAVNAARRQRVTARQAQPAPVAERFVVPTYYESTLTASSTEPRRLVFDDLEAASQPATAPEMPMAAPARAAYERPSPADFEFAPDELPAASDLDAPIGSRPWEPVPVPRPVYTTKPAAPPRRRAPIDEPLLPAAETAAELESADDLEEILDRRWAVND